MFKDIITGDWITKHTSARQRRIVHYWFTIVWLTIGTVIWYVLKDVIWFVGFMSLYAIWWTHLSAFSGETPVEKEEDEGMT